MKEKDSTLLIESEKGFVLTPYVENICQKCLSYLKSGYPIHLTGLPGTGKTTLALYLAGLLEHPVLLLIGNEGFTLSGIIENNNDPIFRSFSKTEESLKEPIKKACRDGYTLVYDNFSCSPSWVNNLLLSIFEDGILNQPNKCVQRGWNVKKHPDFHAILTSNSEENTENKIPLNSLYDRMITIRLGHYDYDTESAIVRAKTGIRTEDAGRIVDIVRAARKSGNSVTIRAGIALGRILVAQKAKIQPDDPVLLESCADVLGFDINGNGKARQIVERALST
ncbi:MAG: AAA family ATPase [bacterium]